MNLRGFGSRRWERAAWWVLGDLALQLLIVVIGLALLFEPEVLTDPASLGGEPSAEDIAFAFTLAIVAFSGLDASSALAGEVAVSRRGLRRLIAVRVPAAIVPYVGIALVASAALPADAERWQEAPMLGIAEAFDEAWLREPLRYVIAVAALGILTIACNAAMFGLSRLGYSLALNRQVPSLLGRLHPRYNTPFVLIGLGGLLAAGLVLPADLELLAAIYAFGATLAFLLVHLSVGRLRGREPDRDRPFKMPFNVRALGVEWPLTALLGAVMSAVAFASVLVLHDAARWVGLGWMGSGVALYVAYRLVEGKPVFKRVTVPARALTRHEIDAEFDSILVPVLGTPLDDDIMQTAGRLAGEENEDVGGAGAVIEALWVFEVPMSLPLDARVADADLRRARQALAAGQGGGRGVRGRRGGDGDRARAPGGRGDRARGAAARRGGDRAGRGGADGDPGGLRLGGKQGLHDSFVGETTRYVLLKAPCRVILTAPPSADHVDPTLVDGDTGADQPLGHPLAHGGSAGSPR